MENGRTDRFSPFLLDKRKEKRWFHCVSRHFGFVFLHGFWWTNGPSIVHRLGAEYHQIVLSIVNRLFSRHGITMDTDDHLLVGPSAVDLDVASEESWNHVLYRFLLCSSRKWYDDSHRWSPSPLLFARHRSSPCSFLYYKLFWWSIFSSRPTKWHPSPIWSVRLPIASLCWQSYTWWITIVERESSLQVYSSAFGFWFPWQSFLTWSIIPSNTNRR